MKFKFVNPSGGVENIYNLAKFCRYNDLDPSHMVKVSKGTLNHSKGWRIYAGEKKANINSKS